MTETIIPPKLVAFESIAMESVAFSFTGNYQTFVVPDNITEITVDACGASGGPNGGAILGGARGGRVRCKVTVVPGETLRVYVGGAGQAGTAGYNGGGAGGGTATTIGGGGGGASDIRRAPYALADRLVVAPGGGGTGGNGGVHNVGHGATPVGVAGVNGTPGTGGGGASASAGGSAGTSGDGTATAGTLGVGGNGAIAARGGGGGGGGLYGGGGAAASGSTGTIGGGGGGGSGLTTGVESVVETGVRYGNGVVLIQS